MDRHRIRASRPGATLTPPLAAAPFVGRQTYLHYVSQTLLEVQTGKSYMVCLQGEAGIGKTRLLREMLALGAQYGFATYLGRCHEDFTPPYEPFLAVLRHAWEVLVTAVEPRIGADFTFLRSLCHPDVSPPTAAALPTVEQAEQARGQVMLAVTRALIGLAQHQPLVVALDDLHWADPGSLEILACLVTTLADQAQQAAVPLLLLVAHRPGQSGERFTRLLARLQREAICTSLDLAGFVDTECMALLQALGMGSPSPSLLHTLMDVTQGSPLFLQELLHYLRQRQTLRTEHGHLVTTLPATDLRLPGQVTAALLARLEPLSPTSRETLSLAALLGEEVSLPHLQAVSGMPETVVLERLDEAVQQGLLASQGQEFSFVHPLLRQALVHLPSVAQRQRLHVQIAQRLMEWGNTMAQNDRAAPRQAIAHHLLQAGPVADATALLHYVRLAGDDAFALCDWPHAAAAYSAVLSMAQTTPGLTPQDVAALHKRAGDAWGRDGDVARSDTHYAHAVTAYHHLEDCQGMAQALIPKTLQAASAAYGAAVDTQELETLLEDMGEDESGWRGRIAVALSEIQWASRQGDHGQAMAQQALALGQQFGNLQLCARASFNLALSQAQNLHPHAAIGHHQAARAYAQQAQDPYMEGWVVQRMGAIFATLGRCEEVRSLAATAYEFAAHTHNWRDYALTMAALTAVEVAMGAFDAAERYAQEALTLVTRYQAAYAGMFVPFDLACAQALRGAWGAAEAALALMQEPGGVFAQPSPTFVASARVYRQLLHTYATDSVPPGQVPPAWCDVPLPAVCDLATLSMCCALVELSVHHGDAPMAARLYTLLEPAVARGVLFTRGWSFLTPRILGLAASLNQWWALAAGHFDAALATATDLGAQPEYGRTCLDYAAMLLARGAPQDRQRALELLHKASLILRGLGMVPFVQRAERLFATLQPLDTPRSPPPAACQLPYSAYELDILTQISQRDTMYLA